MAGVMLQRGNFRLPCREAPPARADIAHATGTATDAVVQPRIGLPVTIFVTLRGPPAAEGRFDDGRRRLAIPVKAISGIPE